MLYSLEIVSIKFYNFFQNNLIFFFEFGPIFPVYLICPIYLCQYIFISDNENLQSLHELLTSVIQFILMFTNMSENCVSCSGLLLCSNHNFWMPFAQSHLLSRENYAYYRVSMTCAY